MSELEQFSTDFYGFLLFGIVVPEVPADDKRQTRYLQWKTSPRVGAYGEIQSPTFLLQSTSWSSLSTHRLPSLFVFLIFITENYTR